MSIINSILSWVMQKRIHQMELFMKFPNEVQQEWGKKLIAQAQETEFGRLHDFKSIKTYREFKERVPLMDYEDVKPFIE